MHQGGVIRLRQRQQTIGQMVVLACLHLVLIECIRAAACPAEAALADIEVDQRCGCGR